MTVKNIWLADGGIVADPKFSTLTEERRYLQSSKSVKVESSGVGTKVRWTQFAPNWSNLVFLCYHIAQLPAPITLNFFNAGWFSEKYSRHSEAIQRIEHLISSSDIRLSTHTYVEAIEPKLETLPPSLREAWVTGVIPHEHAVICALDVEQQRTTVSHVGSKSTLASLWGLSPIAFPRQTGHSYDLTVSRNYFEVLRRDRAAHDHVLSAMSLPSGEISWIPYHRVILPGGPDRRGRPTVQIMTESAPVRIRLV